MSIELLSPAGDMERLRMAVAYGADAVYLAGSDFGMRAFAGNFTPDQLREAVAFCHARDVKVHVTCNTMPRNDEVSRLPAWLELIADAGVDAVILADLGVFALAGRHAPGLKRHVSTQAGVTNYEVARAWHDLGADRVILARELSLEEVAVLRAKTPKELEIEAFVHGAMCELLGPVPALQLHDGPGRPAGRLRPALPLQIRPDGGKAPRRVLPRL